MVWRCDGSPTWARPKQSRLVTSLLRCIGASILAIARPDTRGNRLQLSRWGNHFHQIEGSEVESLLVLPIVTKIEGVV